MKNRYCYGVGRVLKKTGAEEERSGAEGIIGRKGDGREIVVDEWSKDAGCREYVWFTIGGMSSHNREKKTYTTLWTTE